MKELGLLLVIAAALLFVVSLRGPSRTDRAPFSVPVEFQDAVEPIRRAPIDKADAAKLAEFYKTLANVIERGAFDHWIKTAGEVRELNRRAGKMCFGSDIAGKYPGLADDIDKVIALGVGAKRTDDGYEDVEITETRRHNLAIALRSIAAAVAP